MAERNEITSNERRGAGGHGTAPAVNGNGHHANGNGHHANGNGRHSNGNGNGFHLNGNGHANGNGTATAEEVRRVATEMGNAMLATTSVDTARHSDDVELITDAIAEKFDLSESERSELRAGARLHDIGKAAVPPEILVKPGPLDADEWDVMLQHTVVGEQILSSVNELAEIGKLVRHSHERWDGDGYPDGLEGDQIPLGSRIIFCADAFHAVRSDRPYREGRSAGAALTEIRRCSGTQFDPDVVAALETVVRELQIIGPGRRAYRSSRLTALLLALVVGTAGSAIGGSKLIGGGDPGSGGNEPAAAEGGVLGQSAGSKGAQGKGGQGQDANGSAGSKLNGAGAGAGSVEAGQGGGASESGGGGNDHANPDSWAGGGSPGQSENAPGHGGSCPGNSCNAPGHQGGGPGHSAHAPGQQPGGPGNSGNAPGFQSTGPGNSANAPGHQSGGPGNSGHSP